MSFIIVYISRKIKITLLIAILLIFFVLNLILTFSDNQTILTKWNLLMFFHRLTFYIIAFFVIILILIGYKSLSLLAFSFLLFSISSSEIFTMGYYGALLDGNTGIVPLLRQSALVSAYSATGHLYISDIDPHTYFFSEHLLIYILSQINSLNLVITNIFIVEIIRITLGICIFGILFNYIDKSKSDNKQFNQYLYLLTFISSAVMFLWRYVEGELVVILFVILIYLIIKNTNKSYLVNKQNIIIILLLYFFISTGSFSLFVNLTSIFFFIILIMIIKRNINKTFVFLTALFLIGVFRILYVLSIKYIQAYYIIFTSILNTLLSPTKLVPQKSTFMSKILYSTNLLDYTISLLALISFILLQLILMYTNLKIVLTIEKYSYLTYKSLDFNLVLSLSIHYLIFASFFMFSAYINAIYNIPLIPVVDKHAWLQLIRPLILINIFTILKFIDIGKSKNIIKDDKFDWNNLLFKSLQWFFYNKLFSKLSLFLLLISSILITPLLLGTSEIKTYADTIIYANSNNNYNLFILEGNQIYKFFINFENATIKFNVFTCNFTWGYYILPLSFKGINVITYNGHCYNSLFHGLILSLYKYEVLLDLCSYNCANTLRIYIIYKSYLK